MSARWMIAVVIGLAMVLPLFTPAALDEPAVEGGRSTLTDDSAADPNAGRPQGAADGVDITRGPRASFLVEILNGSGNVTGDLYGHNVTGLEDVNGDDIPDLALGAPYDNTSGKDAGAVYVFFGGESLFEQDLNATFADVIITGEANGSLLGWDVAGAGDVNGDGYGDLVAGAPGKNTGTGAAYLFLGGPTSALAGGGPAFSAAHADAHYHFLVSSVGLGTSVSSAGDFDDDGYDDVIVGAPGADEAYLFLGAETPALYPKLWDYPADKPQPVDFTSGAYNDKGASQDLNTWGRLAGDDGWDWIDGTAAADDLYGTQFNDFAYLYGPPEAGGADAEGPTADQSGRLEVQLGPSHQNGIDPGTGHPDDINPGAGWDSGGWGVELNITSAMWTVLQNGGTAHIGFDFEAWDTSLIYWAGGTEEECHVKSRITNSTGSYLLGWDFTTVTPTGKSVWFHSQPGVNVGWGPFAESFTWDVTEYIDGAGTYYLDVGALMGQGGFGMGNWEGMRVCFDNISMVITGLAPIQLLGHSGSGFGGAVSGGGDFDGDGFDDIVVGAPYEDGTGSAFMYAGRDRGDVPPRFLADDYTSALPGEGVGESMGTSVCFLGDFDGDGLDDIAVGAPENVSAGKTGGAAKIFLGRAGVGDLMPDLWDDPADTPQPIDFTTSVYNDVGASQDVNTFGPGQGDDGWDWANNNPYGGPANMGYVYGSWEPGGADGEGITGDNSSRLEVQIGPSHRDGVDQPDPELGGWPNINNPQNDQWSSAAWGVEVNITQAMVNAMNGGSRAMVGFDYWTIDAEIIYGTAGTEEQSYIKCRFGDAGGMSFLGTDLGGDGTNEVFYHQTGAPNVPWGPVSDRFTEDVSPIITGSGMYYLDFGCRFGGGNQGPNEGIRAYFDNITFKIKQLIPHDIAYVGNVNTGLLGMSVAGGDVDGDGLADLVAGSPLDNTVTAGRAYSRTGAFFVFTGNASASGQSSATGAEYIVPGGPSYRGFGHDVGIIPDMTDDGQAEVLVGEPGKASQAGQGYIYTITSPPEVTVDYPNGGEVVSGEIVLQATATDANGDLNSSGVLFYISGDGLGFDYLGNNETPDTSDAYYYLLDTTQYPDGDYWIRAAAGDRLRNLGQDESDDLFTIDNPDPPELAWVEPFEDDVLTGDVDLLTLAYDPDDNIDERGVEYLFSPDGVNWTFIGNAPQAQDIGGEMLHRVVWNTTLVPNGDHRLLARVNDTTGFTAQNTTNVTVYNAYAPSVAFIFPTGGEILSGVVHITLNATDPDDNILSRGVTLTYSNDFVTWKTIGDTGPPETGTTHGFFWDTTQVLDGAYTLRAEVEDEDGLTDTAGTALITINQGAAAPPEITLLAPTEDERVSGTVEVRAEAMDPNFDISPSGVTFYHRAHDSPEDNWVLIGSDPQADPTDIYTTLWNTRSNAVKDGLYIVRAVVYDSVGNMAEDTVRVAVSNSGNNPPIALMAWPADGAVVEGEVELLAFGYDLDEDLSGARFQISFDGGTSWEDISEDTVPPRTYTALALDFNDTIAATVEATGVPYKHYFAQMWDPAGLEEGQYDLRATVFDTTPNTGATDPVRVEVKAVLPPGEPPEVTVVFPAGGETVSGDVTITSEVTDPDGDLDFEAGVIFYIVRPGQTEGIQLATVKTAGGDGTGFSTLWDTRQVEDGPGYKVLVTAVDLAGRPGEALSGEFTVDNSQVVPDGDDGEDTDKQSGDEPDESAIWPLLLLVAIVITAVLLIVLFMLMGRREDPEIQELLDDIDRELHDWATAPKLSGPAPAGAAGVTSSGAGAGGAAGAAKPMASGGRVPGSPKPLGGGPKPAGPKPLTPSSGGDGAALALPSSTTPGPKPGGPQKPGTPGPEPLTPGPEPAAPGPSGPQ